MKELRDKLFVINKHKGPSSFEVVEVFRRISRIRKVGHTGTLDPLAEGVLLLCTGIATRAVEHFMDLDKTYEFELRLGVETTTLDAEGEVVKEVPCPDFSRDEIIAAAKTFLGDYQLAPPAFSAVKRNGRRLYRLARAGKKPQTGSRLVKIYELDVLDVRLPLLRLRLRCSRGTYVRSLARDFGERLGVPAYVHSLIRTRIHDFAVEDAFPGERLFNGDVHGLRGIQLSEALSFLPGIVLSENARRALIRGALPADRDVVRTVGDVGTGGALRILDEAGELLAVGKRVDAKRKRLFWVDSYRLFVVQGG